MSGSRPLPAAMLLVGDDHRDHLGAGGHGFVLGDGGLRYGPETVLDVACSLSPVSFGSVSVEAQRFRNPAFNRDRGPVNVVGIRVHLEV